MRWAAANTQALQYPQAVNVEPVKIKKTKIHRWDYYIEMLDRDVCARVHVIQWNLIHQKLFVGDFKTVVFHRKNQMWVKIQKIHVPL